MNAPALRPSDTTPTGYRQSMTWHLGAPGLRPIASKAFGAGSAVDPTPVGWAIDGPGHALDDDNRAACTGQVMQRIGDEWDTYPPGYRCPICSEITQRRG